MNLTPAQSAAITSDAFESLVVAGAGSGKTSVLTERVAYLLREGASPYDIWVFTFTRKAAGEMRERLGKLMPPSDLRKLKMGTFHSVALDILNGSGEALGYKRGISVYDDVDAMTVIESVGRDLGFRKGRKWMAFTKKELAAWWGVIQNTGDNPTAEVVGNDQTKALALHRLMEEYRARLFEQNALDYSLILTECNRLFDQHPDVLQRYQGIVKHVLVDEYQDTDLNQYKLHDYLSPPATLYVVGDIDQAIYSWRGARPELMLNLAQRRPELKVFTLEDCFRCGAKIVTAANRLIEHNEHRLPKTLVSRTGHEGTAATMHGRSADVAKAVQYLAGETKGYELGEICVLGRSHRTLKRLETVLNEHQVPCVRIGSYDDECNTPGFRAVHAALRLCVNEWDNLAFMQMRPFIGLDDPTAYATIRNDAAASQNSHWAAWHSRARGAEYLDSQNSGGEYDYRGSVAHLIEKHHLVPASNGFSIAAAALTFVAPMTEGHEDDEEYVAQLECAAGFWKAICGEMGLREGLNWFAVKDVQDVIEAKTDDDRVTLMTVHAAKGLEWPAVVVVGLNERSFPSSRGDEEEERRLCYVAATRAKDVLLLHYRQPGDMSPEREWKAPPSRFLGEMGL